ncbi:putative nuclease HARBI1 [Pyxicephalus adspersus]|uniref:putative nuclease HARBI1 n=1 Tax=Pyxicephalus adspersus TaxID=30357 RepID=UPI003B5C358C
MCHPWGEEPSPEEGPSLEEESNAQHLQPEPSDEGEEAAEAEEIASTRVPLPAPPPQDTSSVSESDKGYGQLRWLMTAVRHPRSEAEHNYNKALHKSQRVVEHTIGLLKARFLCLAQPGGELLYAPWKAA